MIPPSCISHWFAYLLCNYVVLVRVESITENTDGYEDSDWLHRNHSYELMQIDKDNTCTILVSFVPNTNYFFVVFV